jgi:hypothetical protein
MKAIRLFLISFIVLCVSTTNVVASEESDRAKIQRAMKAAPSSISAGATIRDVDADWTILRHGAPGNAWTCFPGVPVNSGDKHPMCNDEVWMDWLWAVKALLEGGPWTFSTETIGTSYMLRGDALVNNANPLATDPYDGGLWDQEGPHVMMLFPTLDEIAHLPRDPNAGGPYVMWDGWPLVHVMIPITDRDR